MKTRNVSILFVLLVTVCLTAGSASAISGTYLLSFHACDPDVSDCSDPRNHRIYLAQSDDGANWSVVPDWETYEGSVPDVIRRGDTLYVYTCSRVRRYDFATETWESPVSVELTDTESPDGFVDPSLIIDDQDRLVLFYLVGIIGQDPAGCAPGETSCVKHFRSATEVDGSDGAQFVADSGDRVQVTIPSTSWAADPDIFYDGNRYVIYIARGQSIQVYTSQTLRGEYTLLSTLPDGYLTHDVGVGSGYFDQATFRYWTYGHTFDGIIRRAVHVSLDESLSDSDFTTVLTGSSIGLEASYFVYSPGFAVNGDRSSVSNPIPVIQANNSADPISVSPGTSVAIKVGLTPGSSSGQNADWWLLESTPSGTFNYYNLSSGLMVQGLSPTHQGPLFNLGSTQLLNSSDLTVGIHTFYFGVDLNMNGSLDMDSIYYDSVGINVTGP